MSTGRDSAEQAAKDNAVAEQAAKDKAVAEQINYKSLWAGMAAAAARASDKLVLEEAERNRKADKPPVPVKAAPSGHAKPTEPQRPPPKPVAGKSSGKSKNKDDLANEVKKLNNELKEAEEVIAEQGERILYWRNQVQDWEIPYKKLQRELEQTSKDCAKAKVEMAKLHTSLEIAAQQLAQQRWLVAGMRKCNKCKIYAWDPTDKLCLNFRCVLNQKVLMSEGTQAPDSAVASDEGSETWRFEEVHEESAAERAAARAKQHDERMMHFRMASQAHAAAEAAAKAEAAERAEEVAADEVVVEAVIDAAVEEAIAAPGEEAAVAIVLDADGEDPSDPESPSKKRRTE